MSVEPLLVVGLGNPGTKYASTRHNVGWFVLDRLATVHRSPVFREKFSGEYTKCDVGGSPCVLLRPLTFMNESGKSVRPASTFFHAPPRRIVVIHDELDLPFGEVRIKIDGGHAGHNGLRSIIQHLGSAAFARIRVGIGRPPAVFRGSVADFVLDPFEPSEAPHVPALVARAVEALEKLAAHGLDRAMNELNARGKPGKSRARSGGSPPTAKAPVETPPGETTKAESTSNGDAGLRGSGAGSLKAAAG